MVDPKAQRPGESAADYAVRTGNAATADPIDHAIVAKAVSDLKALATEVAALNGTAVALSEKVTAIAKNLAGEIPLTQAEIKAALDAAKANKSL